LQIWWRWHFLNSLTNWRCNWLRQVLCGVQRTVYVLESLIQGITESFLDYWIFTYMIGVTWRLLTCFEGFCGTQKILHILTTFQSVAIHNLTTTDSVHNELFVYFAVWETRTKSAIFNKLMPIRKNKVSFVAGDNFFLRHPFMWIL